MWCLFHGAKLIISGQAGLGWDDKLNLWVFPDVFVGLTEYQCRWARKVNPFVKVIKIPNGVDLDSYIERPHIHKEGRGHELQSPGYAEGLYCL